MKAIFSILLPNGVVLTATGRFSGEEGGSGLVSFHPTLAPWFIRPRCTLADLAQRIDDAARAVGGTVSVLYLALENPE
jgi:hypothetical protein